MVFRELKRGAVFVAIACFTLLFAGCPTNDDSTPQQNATGCSPRTALIIVGESYFEHFCGCNETIGTRVFPSNNENPNTFTCTVNRETLVVFQFISTIRVHQVFPTSPNPEQRFPASPLVGPTEGTSPSHAHLFNQVHLYPFKDAFTPNLQGIIIVQ